MPTPPLTVDTKIPVRIAALLAERLKVFVAPAVSYGARSLPRPKSALALCEEICSQFVALIQEHMGAAPLREKGASRKI